MPCNKTQRHKETINSSTQNLVLALTGVSVRQAYSIKNPCTRIEKLLNINMKSIIITVHTGVRLDLDTNKDYTSKDTEKMLFGNRKRLLYCIL